MWQLAFSGMRGGAFGLCKGLCLYNSPPFFELYGIERHFLANRGSAILPRYDDNWSRPFDSIRIARRPHPSLPQSPVLNTAYLSLYALFRAKLRFSETTRGSSYGNGERLAIGSRKSDLRKAIGSRKFSVGVVDKMEFPHRGAWKCWSRRISISVAKLLLGFKDRKKMLHRGGCRLASRNYFWGFKGLDEGGSSGFYGRGQQ